MLVGFSELSAVGSLEGLSFSLLLGAWETSSGGDDKFSGVPGRGPAISSLLFSGGFPGDFPPFTNWWKFGFFPCFGYYA